MEELETAIDRALALQNLLTAVATGSPSSDSDYVKLRNEFVQSAELKQLVPDFVRTNRDLGQFWQFIKHKFATYAERRQFIWKSFEPLIEHLEGRARRPVDNSASQVLRAFNEDSVHSAWEKALERRATDPEGAITASRTLLESVCKTILEKKAVRFDENKIELHELYKLTAAELRLSPSQHSEEVFKQILGGCAGIVNGLGTLRNRFGDAHGKGSRPIKPAPRHAELAVNLAGAVALFLVSTYDNAERSET